MKVLSLLTAELFQEVSRRTEEELKASFGPKAGGLLWSQAECEERFDQENMSNDRLHMETDDDNFETKTAKNKAKRNAI